MSIPGLFHIPEKLNLDVGTLESPNNLPQGILSSIVSNHGNREEVQ
jgi:hypothetical protein